ncbi:MAG: hypothetical protein IPN79_06600 [Saprospiraceae bacterium]|nr:hypothetical protein [Saprospiraceae bacterium]
MFTKFKTYIFRLVLLGVTVLLFMQISPSVFSDNPVFAGWPLEIEENLPENEKETETKHIHSSISEINHVNAAYMKDVFYTKGNFCRIRKNYDLQTFHNIFTPPETHSVVSSI